MTPDLATELPSGRAALCQALRGGMDALLTRLLVEGPQSIHSDALAQLAAQAEAAGLRRFVSHAADLAGGLPALKPEERSQALTNLSQSLDQEIQAPEDDGRMQASQQGGTRSPAAPTPSKAAKTAGIAEDLELLSDFVVEAREHLTAIEGELLALERDPQNATVMNAIFRAFHTIKGMAGFLELETVQRVAHHVETVLDLARNFKLAITPRVVDLVLESADFLRIAVKSAELRAAGQSWVEQEFPVALVERLKAAQLGPIQVEKEAGGTTGERDRASSGVPVSDGSAAPASPGSATGLPIDSVASGSPLPEHSTVLAAEILAPVELAFMKPVVPADRRRGGGGLKDDVPLVSPQVQEAAVPPAAASSGVSSKEAAKQAFDELSKEPLDKDTRKAAGGPAASAPPKEGAAAKNVDSVTVRVETGKLDHLLEMIGEMVIAQSLVEQHPAMAALEEPLLAANLLLLARITKEVQSAAMGVRMNPIGQLFQRSARLVRDLARRSGKDVQLEMAGEDTEIDRKIAEELADPLMHMIRNALDHGIESPSERAVSGKNPLATLRLAAYHQGGQIVVEIADDGRGLNRQKILAKAMQNRLVDGSAELSDDEVNHLIFEPGFSTAEVITDISGRGVGMDVVKRQVQKLRGRIEIESELGKGTQFFLKLPLTLAILDVLIVGVGANRYLLPIASVRQIFRPTPDMLSSIHGTSEMVLQHDRLLPIIRLHQRFQVEPRAKDPCAGLLIEAECEGRVFCLMVDEMLGRQEVVMKSLGDMFKGIPGVASCAILGDGRVGLILDLAGIFAAPGLSSAASGRGVRPDASSVNGVPAYLSPALAVPGLDAEAQRAQVAGSASMGR